MHRRTVYKSGSSKLEKVVGKADKTCFITGTFIKHGNVGELQTDCYIRVCGSTAVTQPSKHSTKNREYMCKSVDIIKLQVKRFCEDFSGAESSPQTGGKTKKNLTNTCRAFAVLSTKHTWLNQNHRRLNVSYIFLF